MKFLQYIRDIQQKQKQKQEEKNQEDLMMIFSDIIGHTEVKESFVMFLSSNESIAVLQSGPPACSKTLFLLAIKNKYKDSFWVDGGNASGAGLLDEMLDRKNTTHLLIDEIDGLKINDQKALFNLLETGILSSVKVRNKKEGGNASRSREFHNLKVFATCNDLDKLSKALKSRFFRIHHREYTREEFIDIAVQMYQKKPIELTEYVANCVWDVIGSKDIRDYVKIIKHSKNSDDADKLIQLQMKYKESEEEIDE